MNMHDIRRFLDIELSFGKDPKHEPMRLKLAGMMMKRDTESEGYNFAQDIFDTPYSNDLVGKLAEWAMTQDAQIMDEIRNLLIKSITYTYRSDIDELIEEYEDDDSFDYDHDRDEEEIAA